MAKPLAGHRAALHVVLAYAFGAGLWLAFADAAIEAVAPDSANFLRSSTGKGIAFVAATSLFLFLLVRRQAHRAATETSQPTAREYAPAPAESLAERSTLEATLRDREEKLAAIIGFSPSALSLKTPDGRYAIANPNLQLIHGLSEAEIIGKTDFDLYPEDFARVFQANEESVLRMRQRLSVEETVPVAGTLRTFMSHMFPVLGEAGQVRYICRISLDITERKQAEAEVRQLTEDLAATLHAIPDLLFELDEDGRYVKVEATAENLLAAPATELVGHTVDEMLPPPAAAVVMAAIAAARQGGTDYGRTLTLPLAGGDRHFELSVARKAVPGGGRPHFVVLSRDITARMRGELELRRSNEELARFDAAAIGRELQMIALKRQINGLSRELGRDAPFDLSFAEDAPAGGQP